MKLLGWMHRKLMQNSIDQIKNPTIGAANGFSLQTISNEHNYFMEPSRLSHSNITFHNSSSYSESPTKFEESFEFLSIGTFGEELLNTTEPPTPTLPMEITENDLNLINLELEKFLDAQETTEFCNDTSERSSHASIITLCYKPNDGAESEGHVQMAAAAACPLQNYLFAASVELVETEKEVKKERASLGELFKRSNIGQDDAAVKKCEGAEQQPRKGNVAHFMKKVVKKFHSSSTAASNPTKKKLSKSIVKMFQKKVYPEEMTEKQYMKMSKGRNKSLSHEDTHKQHETKKSKNKTIKLCLAGICKGASPVNAAGHWIKTDSDYLVLELEQQQPHLLPV